MADRSSRIRETNSLLSFVHVIFPYTGWRHRWSDHAQRSSQDPQLKKQIKKAMPLARGKKSMYKYDNKMGETNETGVQLLREDRLMSK